MDQIDMLNEMYISSKFIASYVCAQKAIIIVKCFILRKHKNRDKPNINGKIDEIVFRFSFDLI